MVAASVGRGPFLMQMGEEIFYGAFAADGSPLVARLTESTGENAILLSGVGVRTYGVSVLAADEEAIYLMPDGPQMAGFLRLARTPGASPTQLDQTDPEPLPGAVEEAVVVGGEIFYSSFGTGQPGQPAGLFAVDKLGGIPRSVVPAFSGRGLRAFGDSLFFAYANDSDIDQTPATATMMRVPLTGGPPEVIADGTAPPWFAVDASGIYWIEGRSVMAMPPGGGVPRDLLGPSANTVGLQPFVVVAGGHAYVSINKVPSDPTLPRTQLLQIPLAGGPARLLYESAEFNDLGSPAVVGDWVYFPLNDPTPQIVKVPRCGCGKSLD